MCREIAITGSCREGRSSICCLSMSCLAYYYDCDIHTLGNLGVRLRLAGRGEERKTRKRVRECQSACPSMQAVCMASVGANAHEQPKWLRCLSWCSYFLAYSCVLRPAVVPRLG